jgi:hypothetical protein
LNGKVSEERIEGDERWDWVSSHKFSLIGHYLLSADAFWSLLKIFKLKLQRILTDKKDYFRSLKRLW